MLSSKSYLQDGSSVAAIFKSIVYNRAIVYKRQNFLIVIVHVMIIDQCNQNRALDEIPVMVIYSCAILVTLTSECRVKRGYL